MKKFEFFLLLGLLCLCPKLSAQHMPTRVFPTPQEIEVTNQPFISADFRITGLKSVDSVAISFLKEILPFGSTKKAIPIKISLLKDKQAVLQRSGAYRLKITDKSISIEIKDDRSLFYAVQTIKQLVSKTNDGKIKLYPCMITDYPDVAYRGTVEGFYGTPWSFDDRIEQLRFYGKIKMNTYIYGPKDDPYHSSPSWREPYPAAEAKQIEALVAEANRNKVDFVWAIHPGKDIQWNKNDSIAVLNKFEMMYGLGIRSFAVFFDDISGEGTQPEKQAGLLNYIHNEFIKIKKDVNPLIMCPTEYNKSWSNPKPNTYLDILGEKLDPSILVMWTGDRVVGDITLEGLNWVNTRIKRNAFVWWNFPVSDYVRDHLLMGPSYGLDIHAKDAMSGFVSNPMDKPEASKVGIFGAAMYAWNLSDYDSNKEWIAVCNLIMHEAPEAFKVFCDHNSDPGINGHRYRRDESVESKPVVEKYLKELSEDNFPQKESEVLACLFKQIAETPATIRAKSTNESLIKEIDPWLIQFEHLGLAGSVSLKMASAWKSKNTNDAEKYYSELTSLLEKMQIIDKQYNQNEWQPGVKTGSLVLKPFIIELYRLVGEDLKLSKNNNLATSIIFTNIDQISLVPIKTIDNDVNIVPLLEPIKIKPGEYIGILIAADKKIAKAQLNLPSPTLDWQCLEWSENGQTWEQINGKTELMLGNEAFSVSPKAKYLRLRNDSSSEQIFNLKNFRITTK